VAHNDACVLAAEGVHLVASALQERAAPADGGAMNHLTLLARVRAGRGRRSSVRRTPRAEELGDAAMLSTAMCPECFSGAGLELVVIADRGTGTRTRLAHCGVCGVDQPVEDGPHRR
jgi:hypothetical protein